MKEKEKNIDRKERRNGASYGKSMRVNWFCCAFKLGFVQLKYKASLVFKKNLELALSITLKERELYESKACCGGV